MAHPKLNDVRRRYHYRCGYCGVSETDIGGELTVDHFLPPKSGGDESDDNLVYCCVRCNQYKGKLSPLENGGDPELRLLHPLLDELAAHLQEETNGTLTGLSKTGTHHIHVFRLNRDALLQHRLEEKLQAAREMYYANLEAENDELLQENRELKQLVAALKRQRDNP